MIKMLSFMYHDVQVNFDFNPMNSKMMVNATQMAKIFDKRIDVFLKTDSTKEYIAILQTLPKNEKLWSEFPPFGGNSIVNEVESTGQFPPFGGNSEVQLLTMSDILQTRGHQGTWMHRLLAIEFAAWLEPTFKLWVNLTIENLIYGNYKKHYEAHAVQEEAKEKMDNIKSKLLLKGGKPEQFAEYFENMEISKKAGALKSNAIRSQLKIFGLFDNQDMQPGAN